MYLSIPVAASPLESVLLESYGSSKSAVEGKFDDSARLKHSRSFVTIEVWLRPGTGFLLDLSPRAMRDGGATLATSGGDLALPEAAGAAQKALQEVATIWEPVRDIAAVAVRPGDSLLRIQAESGLHCDSWRRTAVGIAKNGRYLYTLVAEARIASRATGLTLSDVGAWRKRLGAYDGLHIDGGELATLVVCAPDSRAVRVDRTVENCTTRAERAFANHLGVRVEVPCVLHTFYAVELVSGGFQW